MVSRAPYGSWSSPLSAERVVAASVGLGQVILHGDAVTWTELRPHEGGRSAIVRLGADGRAHDLLPPPWSARTRVHEYGGGAIAVAGESVVFSSFDDQRVRRLDPGAPPRPLTAGGPRRYADFAVDARRDRLVCVREDHGAGGEPENTLVAIPLAGGAETVLARGRDFYASPRISADGRRLAWLCWDHPNMPWDGCELFVAELDAAGALADARLVAGGPEESIFQPEWSPGGALHFVTDASGFWNPARVRGGPGARVEPLCLMEAEFGVPQWAFGLSTYAVVSEDRLICAYTREGRWRLGLLDASAGRLEPVGLPDTEIASVRACGARAVFAAASPREPTRLLELDLATRRTRVLRRLSEVPVGAEWISAPEPVEFPTGGGRTAHALFHPPRNPGFDGPPGEKPPLIVRCHGGPTGAASTELSLRTQYFTSRGIGVVDVNYGGSTRYGRAYRKRLEGQWGVLDVDDCVNAARHLVARGLADGERLAIAGGSAGGYTALCALTFRDAFRAGASHYGVSDLEALDRDTHKFESRYTQRLVGGPLPERRDLYLARSPIHHSDRLARPVIFFQGTDDRVVPPSQTERMVEALRRKGVPVAYLAFEGEQHGFRRAENVRRALEGELAFYGAIFGFAPADDLPELEIENL